jgi:2-oxoisovalerate dehydrogenase E2 component (dihydrolipoyl transacylase)
VSASTISATSQTFMLPDLGEGLTEAEVVEWHVAPGDEVQVDQVVVTVETAKASVDVPCPYAGFVLTLHGEPGAILEVGKPLLSVSADQSTSTEPQAGADPEVGPQAKSGSGNVLVGYGTSEARRSGRRRVAPGASSAAGATGAVAGLSGSATATPSTPATATATATTATAATPGTTAQPVVAPTAAARVISPVVRRLARDNGISCSTLTPTGPAGVVRRADVEGALQARLQAGQEDARLDHLTPQRGPVRADRTGDIRIPLRGVRRAIAEKMSISRREIPEASVWVDVDATGLMAAKDQIKAINSAAGIGVLALFARISIAGLTKFPELNARVDLQAQEIVQLGDINLSFAAQSPRGLVVPVVHGAGTMTTSELAAALRELTGLAREGRLSPAQMTGGTFTLNNYGVFGTDGATPIINYPEAAMLGVGRIIDRPWAYEGQVALRKVAQLGLTFDHRVCDGGTAGGFLRFVADCVENPAVLLAEL